MVMSHEVNILKIKNNIKAKKPHFFKMRFYYLKEFYPKKGYL